MWGDGKGRRVRERARAAMLQPCYWSAKAAFSLVFSSSLLNQNLPLTPRPLLLSRKSIVESWLAFITTKRMPSNCHLNLSNNANVIDSFPLSWQGVLINALNQRLLLLRADAPRTRMLRIEFLFNFDFHRQTRVLCWRPEWKINSTVKALINYLRGKHPNWSHIGRIGTDYLTTSTRNLGFIRELYHRETWFSLKDDFHA
jgi:hypothetical protein